MSRFTSFLLFVLLLSLSSYQKKGAKNISPVIVELFTSQGCSSCPSADRVLKKWVEKAEKEGIPVIGLSFHVAYWDYIGWKDPYAQKKFTARQRAYAGRFGNSSIYTPQMVVNGEAEFVGSHGEKANQIIEQQLTEPNSLTATIRSVRKEGNQLKVDYSLSSENENAHIHLAIVEKNLSNQVSRGENAGRKLSHHNVVRVFKTIGYQPKGVHYLPIPGHFNEKESSLVLYVQEKNTLIVLGAAQQFLKNG